MCLSDAGGAQNTQCVLAVHDMFFAEPFNKDDRIASCYRLFGVEPDFQAMSIRQVVLTVVFSLQYHHSLQLHASCKLLYLSVMLARHAQKAKELKCMDPFMHGLE